MKIIGLTGSIGMGKSTLATQFAQCGAKVCSSDAIVHRLLAKGGAAVSEIQRYFPGVVKNGAVDRRVLGDIVFADDAKRVLLEQIVHPLVTQEEERFALRELKKGAHLIVFDIPLLFETGAEERCDAVVVATAPYAIQKRRVLARAGMTQEKFERILARQMPDHEKRARADFVVHTGLGKAYSMREIRKILCHVRLF